MLSFDNAVFVEAMRCGLLFGAVQFSITALKTKDEGLFSFIITVTASVCWVASAYLWFRF